jgi:PAS domain S-box-containing protein
MRPGLGHFAVKVVGLTAVYVVVCKFSLVTAVWVDPVPLVWPPSGLALAALLLGGVRFWPGILLGSFLVHVTTPPEPPLTAAAIAVGNTLEAIVGAALLRRLCAFQPGFQRLQDALGLVALAALVSTTVSATIAVASLCWGGVQPWSAFGTLWELWWLNDALGDLVVAPLLLTWVLAPPRLGSPRQVAEEALLIGFLAALCLVVFDGRLAAVTPHQPLAYTVFPLVIWAALRHGPELATLATFVIAILAIVGTRRGLGGLPAPLLHENLVLLQTFLDVVAATALSLAAMVAERRQVEKQRARLAALVESSEDAVIGETLDGMITDWNRGAVELYGYTAEEITGQPADRLIPPKRRKELPEILEYVARGESIEHYETERLRKDGRVIDVSENISPIRDAEGRIIGASSIARDITQRKQAEKALRESHAILQAVAEGTTDAVFVKDLRGRYLMINTAGARFLGKSVDDVLGKDDMELFSPETADVIMESDRRTMAAGVTQTYEEEGTAAGVTRTYLSTKGPYRDGRGEIIGLIGISRDITERKKDQREMLKLQLAREIQQGLFPRRSPQVPGLDIGGVSYPADATGGDYFDYLPMPDGGLGMVIADASGHGIGPALVMTETRAYLRALALSHTDIGAITTLVNQALAGDLATSSFVTLLFAHLDPSSRSSVYTSAGHPLGYVLDRAGALRTHLASTGPPLGVSSDTTYPTHDAVSFQSGDLFLLLTDGVVEARAPDRSAFGIQRALDIVRFYRQDNARQIAVNLYYAVRAFSQEMPQEDDITVVVMKVE